ncbi:MAG TPA: pyridoxamine 5'-phosphate oxidase family protein [Candidatus Binataceae bacterium]
MTKREIDRLLAEPNIAVLSVTAPGGAPHGVPVWYEYRRGEAVMFMDRASFKFRCVQKDPRAALIVDTRKPPYKCVILKGNARTEMKKDDARIRRMSVAYYGKKKGLAFADSLKGIEFAWIILKPARVVSWDYAKDLDAGSA